MSYARSPRAVCSTTIGTRLSARVVMDSRLLDYLIHLRLVRTGLGKFKSAALGGSSAVKVHYFFESRSPLVHRSMRQNPFHYLVFERQTLHLPHRIRVLQVRTLQGGRIAVRADHFVEPCVRAGRIEHDVLAPDDVVDEQAQRRSAPRGLYQ